MRRTSAAGLGAAVLCLALVAAALAPAQQGARPAAAPEVIGNSVNGAPIEAVQLGDPAGGRVGLVVGVIHGDERAGLRVTRLLRKRHPGLDGAQLWVIDAVNPDGLRAGTRKNAMAVDLNRNFPFRWRGGGLRGDPYYSGPAPASEPETQAVMRFAERVKPDVSVWYHQDWNAVLACPGPKSAARYARLVGMKTSCRGKRLRGTAISWEQHAIRGASAFVVELPGGKLNGRAARRHARAAIEVTKGS
ncbi:MAG: M14 family zinc carboxypeptidase [Solirubrobacterales bacterium]